MVDSETALAHEHTMSTIAWLNSPCCANQNLGTLQDHIKLRQWHRYKPENVNPAKKIAYPSTLIHPTMLVIPNFPMLVLSG
ncbi:uncharacterized protein BJ212DRAFT_1399394 [Suillus subaureus]|uniref:Uncharacterized protein n=1 Tax=Suillus subaureus TaxID=48587 RepID=A0A9P7DRC5_9AGAM|nr:uncharacterized protein BJ212DRAFT_1399394 [Suillus subaureus]KAG1801190.1 hypothetical protein BJ212DRAFT_1399394 [Suillus subaureus]